MTQVLTLAGQPDRLDVRELLACQASMPASHRSDRRPKPPEIRANYEIVEALCHPPPVAIGLVDDVLTAGAHFRAAKDLLAERFPGIRIVGLFYARTIRPADVPVAE
jgi:predicted amidophosphoribosyltransferase